MSTAIALPPARSFVTVPVLLILYVLGSLSVIQAIYLPVLEYSGTTFFDGWNFYNNVDNTTWGNVTYLSRSDAEGMGLIDTNDAGNAIIRVDNSTYIPTYDFHNRDSVRITSQVQYDIGSLVIMDAVHLPYGCSVWPSFWTLGEGVWPAGGEIDIVEGVNMQLVNQMALHTTDGCFQAPNNGQSGETIYTNCSTASGCTVQETKVNSYQSGFAEAGGGAFAMQFDVSGIYIWFWSRPDVPASVNVSNDVATLNISDWGAPSAAYPASECNISHFFTPQRLILDITLCGIWAGIPSVYDATCESTNGCVQDNIVGAGNPTYDNAYFEISWIRAYTVIALSSTSTSPTTTSTATTHASQTVTTMSVSSGTQTPVVSSENAASPIHGWSCVPLIGLSVLSFVFAS